jgi:predicted TIM-barrel fold metal-dependent hydrolase
MINRRELLNIAATAGVASVLAADSAQTAERESTVIEIIDTNVSLFHWPFRRLPLDDSGSLVKKLRLLGVAAAWAGSFDGVLHRDVAAVNRRLAQECKRYPELIPIGSVNLELPDWEEDLRRCIEVHDMPGIRLHPNYHGYTLDDSRFARLLKLATAKGRFVQIVATMEDVRTQHPLVRVADVDLAPLPDVMTRVAGAKVQILNYRPNSSLLEKLAKAPGIYFDTARVDGTDAVPKLIERVPKSRVMFGTHAPFLIPEAALIRVHESGQLNEPALRSVLSTNARRVFAKAGT